MSVTVHVPRPLRYECGGAAQLSLAVTSVSAALEQLEREFPSLYRSVCDETGAVRKHVNLFVNDTIVPKWEQPLWALRPGDSLTILPAVSGG